LKQKVAVTIAVPPFLAKALTKAERTAFDSMPYSHRKEYVDWIVAAKKPETRDRRVEKAREKLRERVVPSTAVKKRKTTEQ